MADSNYSHAAAAARQSLSDSIRRYERSLLRREDFRQGVDAIWRGEQALPDVSPYPPHSPMDPAAKDYYFSEEMRQFAHWAENTMRELENEREVGRPSLRMVMEWKDPFMGATTDCSRTLELPENFPDDVDIPLDQLRSLCRSLLNQYRERVMLGRREGRSSPMTERMRDALCRWFAGREPDWRRGFLMAPDSLRRKVLQDMEQNGQLKIIYNNGNRPPINSGAGVLWDHPLDPT